MHLISSSTQIINVDQGCQADAACEALVNIDGILLASSFDEHGVHIIYSLDKLSFEIVIELLGELDFEMDDSFLISLRNTIYCFLEDNAREIRNESSGRWRTPDRRAWL